jgi:tartrate dehydrogenase/decarboxylase/D-malate dehydrogenase
MLDFLGGRAGCDARWRAAHDGIVRAIETVLRDGPRTPDLGGKARTTDLGSAVAAALA